MAQYEFLCNLKFCQNLDISFQRLYAELIASIGFFRIGVIKLSYNFNEKWLMLTMLKTEAILLETWRKTV